MSIANIEQFYQMALKNPEIVHDLQFATDSESFGNIIVGLGRAHGCIFTVEEIGEWIRLKSDDNEESEVEYAVG